MCTCFESLGSAQQPGHHSECAEDLWEKQHTLRKASDHSAPSSAVQFAKHAPARLQLNGLSWTKPAQCKDHHESALYCMYLSVWNRQVRRKHQQPAGQQTSACVLA